MGSVTSTLTFQAPSASGSYEFRFFAANSFARLATSTTVVISTSTAQLVVNGIAPPASVTVAAGAVATVTVSDGPGNTTDWVAFAPVGAAANAYVDWRYLNGTTVPPQTGVPAATLTFAMPSTVGAYEFRLLANDSLDQIAASGTVTVLAPTAQIAINGIAPPTGVAVDPGAALTVNVTGGPANATDWIALSFANAPESSYVAWMYLNGSTAAPAAGLASATLSLTLPSSPGIYEVRLFASDGYTRLATSSPISASSSPAEVTVRMTSPFPGTTFNLPPGIDLSADASATSGTITSVDFFVDAVLVGSATASPYTVSWTSPSEGQHVLTAVAIHSTAAPVTSQPVHVTISGPDTQAGILGAPIVSPPPGSYGPGLTVTLTAAAGAAIRFTTDGSAPSVASPVYSGPISLTAADTVVRAQAFQNGWYDSNGTRASYHLDLEAPTIYATLSPLPNGNGWNATSPVTITFVCSDPAGVQVCPSPMTIVQEGVTEFVSGNAVDAYGHTSTTAVTVKIDSIAPTVSLNTAPENGTTVSESSINIGAAVGDVLSGVTAVRCNGELAAVDNGSAACVVSLHPGLNSVVLSVTDAAGNTASVGRRVTHQAVPTALALSPESRSLFIGESSTLIATTESGPINSGVTWSSSNDAIASVAENGAVTGHLPGEATVTATLDALSATATLRVIASGSTEVRWTISPIPGLAATRPIFANRVDDAGPDLFDVNTAFEVPTVVRALRHDGTQVWSATVEGTPMFGDIFGGLVLRDTEWRSLTRLGGSEESAPWRYESIGYLDERPAQAADGTIYQIEYTESDNPQSYVVGLDGLTGTVKFRVPLPASTGHRDRPVCGISIPAVFGDAGYCLPVPSVTQQSGAPSVSSPIIGLDGEAYVGLVERHEDWRQHGYVSWSCDFSCSSIPPQPIPHEASGLGTFSRSTTVKLLRIEPEGLATTQTLWQTSTAGADTPERVYSADETNDMSELVIDEEGAVFFQVTDVSSRWGADSEDRVNGQHMCPTQPVFDRYCYHVEDEASTLRIARIEGANVTTRTLDTQPGGYYFGPWSLKLIGDNHTAFLQHETGIEAISTQTLSMKWTIPSEGCCENLTAMRDGGVAIMGDDDILRAIDDGGNSTAMGNRPAFEAVQAAPGYWVGLAPGMSGMQLVSAFGPSILEPSYAFWSLGGNFRMTNAAEFIDWPTVRVNCRPIAETLNILNHCYIVARQSREHTFYIGSGPTGQPPPYGLNEANLTLTMSQQDANAPWTFYWLKRSVKPEVIPCMAQARLNWNSAAIEYKPDGPNSNTFASWLVHECKAPVVPSPLALTPGWYHFIDFGVPTF